MHFRAKFLQKKAYGYDQGDIFTGSGQAAEEANNETRNQDHSAMPWMNNETPPNPANNDVDGEALKEFEEFFKDKAKHNDINFPPRD